MEFEVLNEKMEWEARRIAVAFGVETFYLVEDGGRIGTYNGGFGSASMWWGVDAETLAFDYISIGDGSEDAMLLDSCVLGQVREWDFRPQPQFHDFMARGLYRLGFQDAAILSQLPQLTAHEKLELRLSMPREFWPQKWLEEENAG